MPRLYRIYKPPPKLLVDPLKFGRVALGLAYFGCRNRPFFHICVFPDKALGRRWKDNIIEQVGTFDPIPNFKNEKIVALDIPKIKYWIGVRNAEISVPVLELLGLAGLLPLHPKTIVNAKNVKANREEHYAAVRAAYAEQGKDKEDKAKELTSQRKIGVPSISSA